MKRALTGIGAIVFTIALTGVVMAAGQTTAQPQDQTQVQSGDQGSSTNMSKHNGDNTDNCGGSHGEAGGFT